MLSLVRYLVVVGVAFAFGSFGEYVYRYSPSFRHNLVDRLQSQIRTLHPDLHSIIVYENRSLLSLLDPVLLGTKIKKSWFDTYTTSKKHIHLRMRDATGKMYDEQALFRVLLHEATHCLFPVHDTSHGPDFIEAHNRLSVEAERRGLVDSSKQFIVPKGYCEQCDSANPGAMQVI